MGHGGHAPHLHEKETVMSDLCVFKSSLAEAAAETTSKAAAKTTAKAAAKTTAKTTNESIDQSILNYRLVEVIEKSIEARDSRDLVLIDSMQIMIVSIAAIIGLVLIVRALCARARDSRKAHKI